MIVVEQDVDFYSAFGAAEPCPREEGKAKGDGGGVEREQFVFEAEFRFAAPESAVLYEMGIYGIKEIFVEGGGPVLIGICECGLVGGFG